MTVVLNFNPTIIYILVFTDNRSDGKPGSSFWFEVPYAPDSVCTPPQDFSPLSSSEESSLKQRSRSTTIESPHNMHILIVDDSIAVVKMLANKLKVFSFAIVLFVFVILFQSYILL